jgi:hypothetical protein
METSAMTGVMISHSDNLLLRAWRRGELDDASAHAFETRLFFEPWLAEAAEADQALEAGLRAHPSQAPAVRAGRSQPTGSDEHGASKAGAQAEASAARPEQARRSRRQPPWAMLLAAGLGAAAVLPFAQLGPSTPEWRGNVEWVSVDVRRGTADAEPMLVAPRPSTELIAMELPAPAGAAPLTVRLLGERGDTALELAGLQPVDGIVSLAFPRDALAAGLYRIEFRSGSDENIASPALSFRYRPR